jgi:hypothetical protein
LHDESRNEDHHCKCQQPIISVHYLNHFSATFPNYF